MPTIPLPNDFKEFLKLLNEYHVKYLLVGGYAVAYHGYVRATAHLDIWIEQSEQNAAALVDCLTAFGFQVESLTPELFLVDDRVIRMGFPPFRIEVQTSVSGIEFDNAYRSRILESWDDLELSIIDLDHLKANKAAAGRHQDLDDLENLP